MSQLLFFNFFIANFNLPYLCLPGTVEVIVDAMMVPYKMIKTVAKDLTEKVFCHLDIINQSKCYTCLNPLYYLICILRNYECNVLFILKSHTRIWI